MRNYILIFLTSVFSIGLKAQYFEQIYSSSKSEDENTNSSYVSYQESSSINGKKKSVNIVQYKRNNSTVYYKVYDESAPEESRELLDTIVVMKNQLKDTTINRNLGISSYKRNVNALYFNNDETSLEYDPSTNTFYDPFNEIYYDFYSYDPIYSRQVYVPRNHSGQIIVLYRDKNEYKNHHNNVEYSESATPRRYVRPSKNNSSNGNNYNITRRSSRNTYSSGGNTKTNSSSETRKSSRGENSSTQVETQSRSYSVPEENNTRKSSRTESSTTQSEPRSTNSNSGESSGTRKSSRR